MNAVIRLFAAVFLAAAFTALHCPARASSAIGAPALRALHQSLEPQLADSTFGGPLVLQSKEAAHRVDGDVYAVLEHPFGLVSLALSEPGRWCEVLILHLNTKHCRVAADTAGTHVQVRVGKKEEQPVRSATLLDFAWKPALVRADYFAIEMTSGDGPYDTRDYQLVAEAVPLDGARTFLHMGYSLSYGGASSFAMKFYLATIGRDKVGFTVVSPARGGEPAQLVQGMRGVTERNTMRYYLAIDAYVASLAAPPAQQPEKRFAAWFDATERYPRQLHEVDRDAYLRMKRNEYQRQQQP